MKHITVRNKKVVSAILAAMLAASLAGCGAASIVSAAESQTSVSAEVSAAVTAEESASSGSENTAEAAVSSAETTADGALDASDFFTERDLEQTADLSGARTIEVTDGQDVTITEEGVYVLTGSAEEVTIRIEADDTAKVQLVLDGLHITNTDAPAIYVVSADKVFVTSADSENTLTVTGTFSADGDTNTDAVIFSKEDLVLNGTGTVTVTSTENGISTKDGLKITGGTWNVTSEEDAVEAHDYIRVSGGTVTIDSGKDGLHAEDDGDDSAGYIYICGGTFVIDTEDDGIQGTTIVQIDGGTVDLNAGEGIEGTYVQINGGTIDIQASDDGINASDKSSAVSTRLEINGGELTIEMAQGDTDALDSNGDLVINGGTVDITAQFAFDFERSAELNGGTVTVNGEQVTAITNSMMGGGMMGGRGGFGGADGTFPGGADGEQPEMPEGGFDGETDGTLSLIHI